MLLTFDNCPLNNLQRLNILVHSTILLYPAPVPMPYGSVLFCGGGSIATINMPVADCVLPHFHMCKKNGLFHNAVLLCPSRSTRSVFFYNSRGHLVGATARAIRTTRPAPLKRLRKRCQLHHQDNPSGRSCSQTNAYTPWRTVLFVRKFRIICRVECPAIIIFWPKEEGWRTLHYPLGR